MLTYEFSTPSAIVISLVLAAISISAAYHALLSKRDSNSALAWVVFCLVIPLFGPLVYLMFGINRVTSKAQLSYVAKSPMDTSSPVTEPSGADLRPLSLVGESLTGQGLSSCDEIRMLENGEQLYPQMLKDIDAARHKVFCATYIFQDDDSGNQILAALVRAQQRGLDVRVMVDGLGGIAYPPLMGRKLARSGLVFRYFNPITLLPPSLHINMRNHRKILAVDGAVAYTGGQNISDRHMVDKPDNPKCARDLHFRMTGKIVDDLERAFLKDWNHCSGIRGVVDFTPGNINRSESATWTRLIMDGPNENLDKLNDLLVGVLAVAQRRIWIMTPYFLPGLDLIGALVAARLRGVDVKIMLPERTNIHLAHWAAQHNLRQILARDLEVFLQPAPFIHTKALLIDDDYTLIGSANLDPRSLRLNFELGIEVFSRALAQEMDSYFRARLGQAKPLIATMLDAAPPWRRIRNALAWLFSPYL